MFHRPLARSCAWFGLLTLTVATCSAGDPPSTATWSEYPLLAARVLFTVGGLFLLLGG